jgi:CDP-diacylglycerol--serine O-phosphatidyltransferase
MKETSQPSAKATDGKIISPSAAAPTPAPTPIVPKYRTPQEASRIYLLPNLFTAGNMLCGFLSIYSCVEAKFVVAPNLDAVNESYRQAVYFILGACVCDLFDGRVARTFKRESLFGAEFDSIADIISFGLAPALMLCFLILSPGTLLPANANWTQWVDIIGQKSAWVFAFVYLLCVGIRLARFNVLTNPLVPGNEKKPSGGDFVGLPCPIAAGMIASLVLLLTSSFIKTVPDQTKVVFTLFLPITLLISYLMVSNIRYPSFKHINWNTRLKIRAFIGIFLFIVFFIISYEFSIPLLFLAFILNGIFYSARKKRLAVAEPDAETDWDADDEHDDPTDELTTDNDAADADGHNA